MSGEHILVSGVHVGDGLQAIHGQTKPFCIVYKSIEPVWWLNDAYQHCIYPSIIIFFQPPARPPPLPMVWDSHSATPLSADLVFAWANGVVKKKYIESIKELTTNEEWHTSSCKQQGEHSASHWSGGTCTYFLSVFQE
jgi:hypothetical protein